MIINMEWYRIFLYAARLGNLTKAAQELHITQPSVSYAIKQLETSMGIKLFDRLSKGVNLTPEGRALLEYVEQSFSLLDAGQRKMHSLRQLEQGELRVGASGPFIKHLLLPSLDRFHALYPAGRIRLSQGRSSEIGSRLKDGRIDLGLVHMPLEDSELEVTPLSTIQDCFVVGQAYVEQSRRRLSAEDIAGLPLLLLSQGSSTRQFAERWLAAQGIRAEADIELSSLDMLVEFAQRGYGAAFVTRSFVQQELASGRLLELKLLEPIPPRTIGLAIRRGISLSVMADRFLELLKQTCINNENKPF